MIPYGTESVHLFGLMNSETKPREVISKTTVGKELGSGLWGFLNP